MQSVTIEEALKKASAMLVGVAQRPRLEAEILMGFHLGWDRSRLHAHGGECIKEHGLYFDLVRRRVANEPVEYITGRVSFYDIELEVGRGVLIARPETELLVEKAASVISSCGIERMAEIGIGSGAVSIVLARKFPDLHIVATDISGSAIEYAKRNIARYGLSDRIELLECNLLDGVGADIQMLVSNPPYIARSFKLPAPLDYEPENALIGGERGDELLLKIIDTAYERQIPHLLCEMGYDQRISIESYCKQKGYGQPDFYKDLAALDRGFYLKLKGKQ